MLSYLAVIPPRPDQPAFSGTFSDRDIALLCHLRRGRAFELENYMAYITGDGMISLAKKPDYVDGVRLELKELCRLLHEAQAAQFG